MPSAGIDLGELGQQQGEGKIYDWKWYYSASGLAIWLALILAFVVPKTNRVLHILWILVPLVIVNLIWLAFKKLTDIPSSSSQFDTVFHSLVIGVTVLWLAAKYLERFAGLGRFLISFGILMVVTCLGILSYSVGFSNETAIFLAMFVFMALTMLVAMTLSQRLCGGMYRPVHFMLWMALWTALTSWITMFGFVVAVSIITSKSWPGFPEVIWIVVLGGSIFAAYIYVLNFPFMILGFMNPFFRERLLAGLHLKLMPTPTQSQSDSTLQKTQDSSERIT